MEGGKLQNGQVCQTESPRTSRGLQLLSQQQEGGEVKKRSKKDLPRKLSKESQGRRDPTYSRRNTEAQRKSSSSVGPSDYSQIKTRGQEREVSGELPKDQPEDTD